jgi:hypothetical protein
MVPIEQLSVFGHFQVGFIQIVKPTGPLKNSLSVAAATPPLSLFAFVLRPGTPSHVRGSGTVTPMVSVSPWTATSSAVTNRVIVAGFQGCMLIVRRCRMAICVSLEKVTDGWSLSGIIILAPSPRRWPWRYGNHAYFSLYGANIGSTPTSSFARRAEHPFVDAWMILVTGSFSDSCCASPAPLVEGHS